MRRWILICGWLSATASMAQEAPAVEVYPFGSVDLLMTSSSGRGVEVNRLRRGDSPLSHLQANLFADIVVGDDDGVAVVPRDIQADLLVRCKASLDREQAGREQIEAGATTVDIFKLPGPDETK